MKQILHSLEAAGVEYIECGYIDEKEWYRDGKDTVLQ